MTVVNSVAGVPPNLDLLQNVMPYLNAQFAPISAKPVVSTSSVGLAAGYNIANNGAQFGPDTYLGSSLPNVTGPPYTTSNGLQEMCNYLGNSGGGTGIILNGTYTISAFLPPPTSYASGPWDYNNLLLNNVSGVRILGQSKSGVVLQPATGSNYSSVLSFFIATDCEVGYLTIQGNSSGLAAGDNAPGLTMESFQRGWVHDIDFLQTHGSSLVGDFIIDTNFTNVYATSASGATTNNAFDLAFLQNVNVYGARCHDLSGYGFKCQYNSLTSGYNNTGITLYKSQSNNVRLIGGDYASCSTNIFFDDIIAGVISGVNSYNATHIGIQIEAGSPGTNYSTACSIGGGTKVYGNGSAGATDAGIFLQTSSATNYYASLADVDVFDNNTQGVYLSGTNDLVFMNNVRFGNIFTSTQTTPIGGTGNISSYSIIKDCPGLAGITGNGAWGIGKIADPFIGTIIGPYLGSAAAPTASTTYTCVIAPLKIVFTTVGGTSMTTKDAQGNTEFSGITPTTTTAYYLIPGCSINFGAFGGSPPTVEVSGV